MEILGYFIGVIIGIAIYQLAGIKSALQDINSQLNRMNIREDHERSLRNLRK